MKQHWNTRSYPITNSPSPDFRTLCLYWKGLLLLMLLLLPSFFDWHELCGALLGLVIIASLHNVSYRTSVSVALLVLLICPTWPLKLLIWCLFILTRLSFTRSVKIEWSFSAEQNRKIVKVIDSFSISKKIKTHQRKCIKVNANSWQEYCPF